MNFKRISLICAALLFLASFSFGQIKDVGMFVGTVYDPEGLALPGVSLTAKNVETGMERIVTTNERGQYRLERLPRGFYTITVSLPGFKTLVREGLELWAGAELRVDFTLEVGAIEEKITVIAVSPMVETTRTLVSTVITEREMLSYPQGNRNFLSLMAYSPGTTPSGGYRSGYSINGMRDSSNNFMIDGIDNNDQGTAGSYTTTLPPEAIQEFRLIANNFSAEYGRNTGGIINAVMKSGTNELHGSAWIFHRGDSALFQSEDWLTHERPPYKRYMYGATLGGPIIKDKTFFFASFEGTWQKIEAREPYLWFTPEAISRAPAGSAARYFFDNYGDAYPVPSAPYYDIDGDGLIDAGEYVWDGTEHYKGYKFAIKIDHIFGEKDRLAFRWLYNYYTEVSDFANVPGYERDLPWYYHTGGFTWLHLFSPTMYNELRIGYHRDYADWERVAPEVPNFGGYDYFPDGVHMIGDWANMPQRFINDTYQLVDVLNFQVGNHSLKVGGELRYWTSDSMFDALVDGYYLFFDSTWFLYDKGAYWLVIGADPPDPPEGNPYAAGTATDPWARGDTSRKWKGIEGGIFFQDDWRVTDRLTISAGLRWEYFGVPEETSGKGINMPAFGTEEGFNTMSIIEGEYNREGIRYTIWDGRELLGKKMWNTYYKAFAPKFSFAYDLTGDGKTSIRGGAAIAYDRTFNNTYENDRFNYPDFTFASIPSWDVLFGAPVGSPPIYPTIPAEVPMANVTGYKVALRWMQPNLIPQKAYNWMIGIQREIAPNVSIEVNYTGSLGRNLGSIQRPNRFTGDGLDGVYDGINPYGAIGDLNVREQTLKSSYHSLQIVLTKRFSDGWSWYSAYTYGVAKDMNSDYFGDWNMEAVCHDRLDDEWGYARFDRRHRFVGGFVWDMPWFKESENWLLRNVIAGWQFSGNFHVTSARPFSVEMYSSLNDWNMDGDYYERPIWTGGDYQDVIKWTEGEPGLDRDLFDEDPNPPTKIDDWAYYDQNFVDRYAFRWFPTYNINIAIQKYFTVPVGGRDVTIQLIGEVFNLLKNTFWNLPYAELQDVRFGTVNRKVGHDYEVESGVRRFQASLRIMF